MPTPIVQAVTSVQIGDAGYAQTVTTNNGGNVQTSDFPAPVAGTGAGTDVVDTSIQIPDTIVSQAAAPQVTTKATANPSVATHKTKFL